MITARTPVLSNQTTIVHEISGDKHSNTLRPSDGRSPYNFQKWHSIIFSRKLVDKACFPSTYVRGIYLTTGWIQPSAYAPSFLLSPCRRPPHCLHRLLPSKPCSNIVRTYLLSSLPPTRHLRLAAYHRSRISSQRAPFVRNCRIRVPRSLYSKRLQ